MYQKERKASTDSNQIINITDVGSEMGVYGGIVSRVKEAIPVRIFIALSLILISIVYGIYNLSSDNDDANIEQTEEFVDDFAEYTGDGEPNDEYNHPVDLEANTKVNYADKETEYIRKVNQSLADFRIRHNVVSLKHNVDEEELSELLTELSVIFIDNIIKQIDCDSHVLDFFSNPKYVYEALWQQYHHNIPASVILANAADESSYGRSQLTKYGKNFFGIKAKSGYKGNTCHIETPEEFTEAEYKAWKKSGKAVSLKTTKNVGGRKIYVVYIKDYFRKYDSYKESFTDFSNFLRKEERYATIFQKGGANWEEWCKMFRPKRDGGIPYATSTSKSKRLKSIIERYRLNLLDYSAS